MRSEPDLVRLVYNKHFQTSSLRHKPFRCVDGRFHLAIDGKAITRCPGAPIPDAERRGNPFERRIGSHILYSRKQRVIVLVEVCRLRSAIHNVVERRFPHIRHHCHFRRSGFAGRPSGIFNDSQCFRRKKRFELIRYLISVTHSCLRLGLRTQSLFRPPPPRLTHPPSVV